MTLPCIVHLRAWAIEEIQYILEAESEDTQRWAINLGEALLRELVTTATPGVVEATSVAKHGEGRLLSFRDDPQQVRKRSLQRALKRAVNKGKTTYQGRPLRVWSASTPFPQQSPVKHPGPTRPGPERIQCIHWNCSGLSEELKAEWFAWLRQKPEVRIFVLVETHWSFSNSYISDEWHLTHSAKAAGKGGGIMIGVKKECVDLNSIKWREIIPGRLLHWRGSIGKQQVDIAAVYQTALGFVSGDQKSDLMKERHKLWAQLDNLMSSLPFRSSIIVAGDMNLTMAPMSEVAGHGILPGSSAAWLVQEREEVMLLLKKHRLVAINTWCRPNHTYHHPNGKSQIDYIMIRKQMADNLSRKCSTISSPIAAWRSSGHRPLQASIKLNWKPWQGTTTRPSAPAPLAANLEQIASEVRPSLSELQIAVKQQLDAPRALQQKMKPRNMDQEILAVWRQHKYQRKQLQTAQTIPIDAEALDKAAKDARSNLRKLTRSRKRQQLLDTLQAAETAFHEKQMRTHYALLRQLAPKSYRRKLCLRANTSALLSNAQECEWLKEYARELFNDEPFSMPPLLPVDQAWFEESQWVQALERLKAHKAVPHGSAEIASWKQHAKVLAKPLSAIAMNALTVASPTVPTEWSMVQMAWIPKPGKAPTEPGNLRTIGLMGADSKAFLMILKDQAAPWIQQALQNTPQYAYRSMASTCDALLRGSKHCMNVRTALAGVLEDHTSKILHTGRVPLLGGIMVSLDLSKAFDKLQYSEMYESMRETGMPEELSRLIMHVHANTALHIVHGGHRSTTGMRRGLRQGCGVAPIVYACWTIRLCRLINQALRHGWAQEHSSIYADDKHFYWEISSESTMDEAIEQLKTIITIIRTLGMQINFQKSVAVIALKGYMVKRVLQKHTQWRYGIKHLRIRMDTNDIYIPVEAQMQYLGAVLSYTAFEQHTADLRIRQANQNFAQLRKVLRTSGGLSKASQRQFAELYNPLHNWSFYHTYNAALNNKLTPSLQMFSAQLHYDGRMYGIDVDYMPPQRWLHAQASLTELDPGHKPKAHKQKAAPPAYKSFASPLTTAFAKGSSGRQTPQALNPSATMAAQADVHSLQHAALPPIRKVKDFLKVRTGSIKDYMLQTHAPAASSTSSTQATLSCRIQLRNPHNLCYANASILMLLHCVELIALKVPTMNFLIKLGTLATSRGREMLLAQMHQFRQLSPQWEFNNEQKDASEYLHTLFHHTDDLQVVWDSRVIHAGIPRIALQGTHPVAMPLPLQDNRRIPLLEVVEQWHIQQESAAFVHAYPVICIQLNRYIANRKDNRIVEIPDRVRLPFHTNENQVEWREYWIGGAILHLGSTPHRGHYRALLRVDDEMKATEALEQGFFDHYWPAVSGRGPAPSQQSTAPPSETADGGHDDRQKKAPRHDWGKGQGYGQGYGRRGGGKRQAAETTQWRRSADQEWDPWASTDKSKKDLEKEVKQLRDDLFSMQKLLLRHEDFLAGLRAELTWVMFMKLDMKATVVPALFAMQQQWRELKEKSPQQLQQPMRVSLIRALFKELQARLTALPESEEFQAVLKNLGWYEPETRDWAYVKWDPANERLVPDPERGAVGFERLAATFEAMQTLTAIPGAVMRFHPSRDLTEKMTGHVLMFSLQLCIHGDASQQIRTHLAMLTGLSVTQLVGMSVRPERPVRSNLANTVQKEIQAYYG
ncbi:unnamed protein product [Symbiodinium microadriaticum]|nr:unnamed protein product [Symbiodinium microadriaticum]CAE7334283.1 unnamed protein product [Symbiodinium sp. KB8]